MTFLLTVLWFMLLLSSTGIQAHAWYLLAVGGIGMMQNLITAGAPRQPEMLGIPIRLAMRSNSRNEASPIPMVFAEFKVMHTLMELELDFKGAGRALLPEFFLEVAAYNLGRKSGGPAMNRTFDASYYGRRKKKNLTNRCAGRRLGEKSHIIPQNMAVFNRRGLVSLAG
ncbi:hypothetical protein N7453_009923 [Penicillium expansum]|nr:hypothetical protein N7453_009923 [Penicillium expansum]